MVPFILCAREEHAVASVVAYRRKHASAIGEKAALGMRFEVHAVAAPTTARINHGRWIIDCDCGAGNATDPRWGIACCFGCGAVHEHVIFPADWEALEAALVGRPHPRTRNWATGETIEALRDETAAHLDARGAR